MNTSAASSAPTLVAQVLAEEFSEEAGQHYLPTLVGLGLPEVKLAAHIGKTAAR